MSTARICAIDGCDQPVDCRGWCASHYGGWRRHGDPLAIRPHRPRADLIEDIEFMLATSESPAMIAARLHTTTTALEQRLRRAGKPDLARIFDAQVSERRSRYVTQRARYSA